MRGGVGDFPNQVQEKNKEHKYKSFKQHYLQYIVRSCGKKRGEKHEISRCVWE